MEKQKKQYISLSPEETRDRLIVSMSLDINPDTTDDQLCSLAARYEAFANDEGYTLDSGIMSLLYGCRQDWIDDQEYIDSLWLD